MKNEKQVHNTKSDLDLKKIEKNKVKSTENKFDS
jgi:hypothetical protein